jgi:hypothetical protein
VEHADDLQGIRAVARRCASRWREDASRLVQPQSLAAQAAARRHLADQQSVSRHVSRISLARWGKVKEGNCTLKSHRDTVNSREGLLRRGVWLEIGTVAWNALEGIIAVAAGIVASSVALVGFGVDSFVETTSGAVVGWRLRQNSSVSLIGSTLNT